MATSRGHPLLMYHKLKALIAIGVALITYPNLVIGNDGLWEKLKQGGYIVLVRHTTTEKTNDPLLLKLNDCREQRNLSKQGQMEARRIRQAFQDRTIPIDKVLSSRYCRTKETAELAFGQVTTWQPLDLLYALPDDKRDAQTEVVTKRIDGYRGKGNLVMVTHHPNIDNLTLEVVEEGGFLILKPEKDDDFSIIGYISPAELSPKKP